MVRAAWRTNCITDPSRALANNVRMGGMLDLIRDAAADSTLAFREQVYRRGQQAELLRDVIALANAPAVGPRFLFLGVDDRAGGRRIPGISRRSWQSFCDALPAFLASAVEPALRFELQAVEVDDTLVGAVCLEPCEDPPYLLARRVSGALPAGGGWIRRGTRVRRMVRKHLQAIFAARFRHQQVGDVAVGFAGELPREEIELNVLPLEDLPSAAAAQKIERMLAAKRVSRSVLGRTDSRIARLVHAQVEGGDAPYRERGTRTMRIMLDRLPSEHAVHDEHYQYELRAHKLNIRLANHSDRAQADLVLTLKFPRPDGFDVSGKVCAAPGAYNPRHRLYPKVDHGPRIICVQATGLRIAKHGSIDAFVEPLRVVLREAAAGQAIRVAYSLQGPTLRAPVRGRLRILVPD